MSTLMWVLVTNAVTAFVVWRLMALYARHLPAVLEQLGQSKLHEFMNDEDVEWVTQQIKKNPDWLRRPKTGSATTGGQDQQSSTTSPSQAA